MATGVDDAGFGAVQCLLGDGNGNFFSADYYQINVPEKVVTVSDVNSDGKLDAIVACGVGGTNGWVAIGNGDGTFLEPDPWYIYEFVTSWEPRGVAVGDFTSDGKVPFGSNT